MDEKQAENVDKIQEREVDISRGLGKVGIIK